MYVHVCVVHNDKLYLSALVLIIKTPTKPYKFESIS